MLMENQENYDYCLHSPPFVQKLQQNCILGSTQPEFQNGVLNNQLQQDPLLFNIFMDSLQKVKYSTISNSNIKILQIWQIIMLMQSVHILVYIPLQISFKLLNLNYLNIILLLMNIFVYFYSAQNTNKQISLKYLLIKDFIKSNSSIDIFIIAMLLLNNAQLGLLLDWIVILLIQVMITGQLKKLWRRFCQYNLEFYLENLLTLTFKIVIILNTITCFFNILESRSLNGNIEDSFIDEYIASTKVSLSILSLTYQGNEEGIEIRFVSFFTIFLDAYLFHSFLQILSEQGIEIHTYFQSNNFNFVLREQLLNSIAVQNSERKIHFPQRLTDEIKVNQRLPILVKHFKGYDALLLKDIAIKSEEITYQPSEFIIKERVPDDCSIFFLIDGFAEIQSSSFILQQITAPYIFGEMSFFTQQPRLASVVALTKCLIFKVPRQVMIAGLGQTEKELFHEQKDQISLYSNLPIECICCKSSRHCIAQCNVFRIQINPEMTQTLMQTRFEYRRKSKKSMRIIPEQKKSQLILSPCKLVNQAKEQRISVNCLRQNSELSVAMEDMIQMNQVEFNQSKKLLNSQESNKLIHDQTFNLQQQTSELKSYSDTIGEIDQGNEFQLESEISKIPKIQGDLNSPQGVTMYQAMVMSSFQETQVDQDFTFMRLQDFDRYQIFQKYFPQGNIDRILQNIN